MTDYIEAVELILKGIVYDKAHTIDQGAYALISLTPRVVLSDEEQKIAQELLEILQFRMKVLYD